MGSFIKGKTILGKDESGQFVAVGDTNRQSGMYVLGVQGVGKSSLLEQLIYQDICKGYAVVVIDPHGDLVDHCIAQMPAERLSQAFLLDMEDENFPFGLNLLSSKGKRSSKEEAMAVDRVMHVFEAVWGDVLTQQNLPRYLRAGILALREHTNMTLLDLYSFLQDDGYRERILNGVKDASIREFWEHQYNLLTPSGRRREVASLLNRLESLFMGRFLVRNILGQGVTTLDFRTAIEQRKILFIRLPIKTLTQDARLVGTMLVAEIYSAIFSFADTPLERRPGFSLFVDEFQHFATSDFSEMFTEGRKFGSRVCVAHQFRGQLPDTLASATLTAYTKVCFQTTQEDAPKMAPLFLEHGEFIREEDIEPDVVKHLLSFGHPHPAVDRFIKVYLRPVSVMKKTKGQIEVETFYESETKKFFLNASKTPLVPDPLPFLSPFLYEIELRHTWRLQIPFEVLLGFSNSGHGFYNILMSLSGKKRTALSSPDTTYNPIKLNQNWKFLMPENLRQQEQLMDFLISLREVMMVLAEEPIGEIRQMTPAEATQRILNLPRRTALVRGAKGVTHMHTLDAPSSVSGQVLTSRKQQVRDQARKAYCRPKTVVEKEIESRRQGRTGASDASKGQAKQDEPRKSEPSSSRSKETPIKTICPHCKKEQTNRQFCSLCGQDLTKAPRQPRFTEVDDE